jgi:hypothetical protein
MTLRFILAIGLGAPAAFSLCLVARPDGLGAAAGLVLAAGWVKTVIATTGPMYGSRSGGASKPDGT